MYTCMACFREKESQQKYCSSCGWSEAKYKPDSVSLPLRTTLNNHYVIGRVLGQGGFGITYAAWDMRNQIRVAIKEYFPIDIAIRNPQSGVEVQGDEYQELFAYGIQRFADEAHALARFIHNPGIVAVYDLFEVNGTAYMAMEYLEGKTWLETAEEMNGKMPVNMALPILFLACDALKAVHEEGMLHRDVSPDNILILSNGQVKLIDFGAARYAMKQQNQVYSIIFKPGYTPEEQYRSRGELGPCSDIYALGATFYRIITGKVPLDAMNRMEMDTLAWPSKMKVGISPGMESVLMKALAVKGPQRFQTVEDFKSAMLAEGMAEHRANPSISSTTSTSLPGWIWLVGLIFIMLIILLLN